MTTFWMTTAELENTIIIPRWRMTRIFRPYKIYIYIYIASGMDTRTEELSPRTLKVVCVQSDWYVRSGEVRTFCADRTGDLEVRPHVHRDLLTTRSKDVCPATGLRRRHISITGVSRESSYLHHNGSLFFSSTQSLSNCPHNCLSPNDASVDNTSAS
jgi:hypothetical protein